MKEERPGLAQHLLDFCKEKNIPLERQNSNWYIVPFKYIPLVQSELKKYIEEYDTKEKNSKKNRTCKRPRSTS